MMEFKIFNGIRKRVWRADKESLKANIQCAVINIILFKYRVKKNTVYKIKARKTICWAYLREITCN